MGLYTSAAGMRAQSVRIDVVSNNLANLDTPGFRKDMPAFRAFPEVRLARFSSLPRYGKPIGLVGTGVLVDEIRSSPVSGVLKRTGNPLDLAIAGEGFFVVRSPDGDRYTRAGSFGLARGGGLVTKGGLPVMGMRGPVRVGGDSVEIDAQGRVLADGVEVERLRVVSFENPGGLRKVGGGILVATPESGDPFPASSFEIHPGYIETANVTPVTAMVELIEALRWYEANQKAVQAQDETLSKAVNEVAAV